MPSHQHDAKKEEHKKEKNHSQAENLQVLGTFSDKKHVDKKRVHKEVFKCCTIS